MRKVSKLVKDERWVQNITQQKLMHDIDAVFVGSEAA
jgi:hypothetical protein